MADKYVNKVMLGNEVLMDVSSDTVVADKLLAGYTAHGADGAPITGTCNYDTNTTDADALAGEILANKIAYVNKNKIVGAMPNRGGVNGEISDKEVPYVIPQGAHDGTGTVTLDAVSKALLVAENIRENITILGVTGTMSGSEGMNPEAIVVTPSLSQQVITPSTGYNCISQATIEAVPVIRSENAQGGLSVVICPQTA